MNCINVAGGYAYVCVDVYLICHVHRCYSINEYTHAHNAHDYDIASMQWIAHNNNSNSSKMNAKFVERVN